MVDPLIFSPWDTRYEQYHLGAAGYKLYKNDNKEYVEYEDIDGVLRVFIYGSLYCIKAQPEVSSEETIKSAEIDKRVDLWCHWEACHTVRVKPGWPRV